MLHSFWVRQFKTLLTVSFKRILWHYSECLAPEAGTAEAGKNSSWYLLSMQHFEETMKWQHISLERALLPITDVSHMVRGRLVPSPSTHQCSHIVAGIYKDNQAVNDTAQKPPAARTAKEGADFHCQGTNALHHSPLMGDSSASCFTSVWHKKPWSERPREAGPGFRC